MSDVQPFVDSAPLVGEAAALRARGEWDGYFLFRGLIPEEPILALRRQFLELADRHGWVEPGTDLMAGIAHTPARTIEGEPAFMALYTEAQKTESFHALAHRPEILSVLGDLFGDEVLVHPRNIARFMFPQNNQFTTPPHQDWIHIQGTHDTWTAWIPLGDCPTTLGGLEVLVGSHRLGLLPGRPAKGAGGIGVVLDGIDLPWVGSDMGTGDVLFFHSLTVHRATDNRTPDRLRLSCDFRYQGASQPVTESSLLPHHGSLTWEQIYEGWQRPELQYYWRRWDLKMATFTPEYHEAAFARG